MSIAGIDGCTKGWLMIKCTADNFSYGVYENILELIKDNQDLERILIDIPIGLASKKVKRTVERELRRELKFKHSTVFNPTCRESLYENDYLAAKQKNIEVEGRSLSVQSYNISNKIKEIDEYINSKPKVEIIESHPELCFKYLNNGDVLLSKKTEHTGLSERKKTLFSCDKNLNDLFRFIEQNTLRKDVSLDDIADAICLCLVNKLGGNEGLDFIIDDNKFDENGIKIRIAYYKK